MKRDRYLALMAARKAIADKSKSSPGGSYILNPFDNPEEITWVKAWHSIDEMVGEMEEEDESK